MPIKNTFNVLDTPSNLAKTATAGTSAASNVTWSVADTSIYSVGQWVYVSGAAPAGYNGPKKVLSITANTSIVLADTTAAAITTATPVIEILAPLNDSKMTIYGGPTVDFRKIENFTRTVPAAGTAGVITVTPTTGVGTQNIVVSQYVRSLGKVVTATLQYSSGGVAGIVADVTAAWKAQFDALGSKYGFNATAANTATTFAITTLAPDHFVTVSSVGTVSLTSAIATTTAGVKREGYGADLLLEGFTGCTSTNYYIRYEFLYGSVDPKGTAGDNDFQVSKHTVLLSNGTGAALTGVTSTMDTNLQTQLKAVATAAASVEGIAQFS